MMVSTPRPRVDEPLVAQRVTTSPHPWGSCLGCKLVVRRVQEVDAAQKICYRAIEPGNPARRHAERGSTVRLEVCSVLYGILGNSSRR
jgi:hypothetical protein